MCIFLGPWALRTSPLCLTVSLLKWVNLITHSIKSSFDVAKAKKSKNGNKLFMPSKATASHRMLAYIPSKPVFFSVSREMYPGAEQLYFATSKPNALLKLSNCVGQLQENTHLPQTDCGPRSPNFTKKAQRACMWRWKLHVCVALPFGQMDFLVFFFVSKREVEFNSARKKCTSCIRHKGELSLPVCVSIHKPNYKDDIIHDECWSEENLAGIYSVSFRLKLRYILLEMDSNQRRAQKTFIKFVSYSEVKMRCDSCHFLLTKCRVQEGTL